nr:myo-inositol hexakisphosphate phosphohydrolase, 70 kda phytase {EC 3.1.3.8, 3.1.3.26} [rats, intestinal mucosa, Peptide Partial, 10 aa] [Rattus sp.]
VIPVEEENPV